MSTLKLTITVSDISDVISLYDKIQIQRSESGPPYSDAVDITSSASTSATLSSELNGPYNINGQTLSFKINGGNTQTLTFTSSNPVSSTAAASEFTTFASGATASGALGNFIMTTALTGTGSSIEVIGGTALTELGFDAGDKDTGENSEITLVANTSTYEFTDSSGSENYYYRTRYYNSSTDAVSCYSDWIQGADISADLEIGDAPIYAWTQDEICGINILLKQLKARLKSDGLAETIDEYGNIELSNCPIFTDDELVCFLQNSLSEFNQTPHFTSFTFADQVIYDRYAHIIVEGAFILATGAQMLIEAGREFTITDNGITMNPPPLSNVLNNQLGHFVTRHTQALEKIKWSIKPKPTGFGSFRVLASNPNYLRLRHLRQRRII